MLLLASCAHAQLPGFATGPSGVIVEPTIPPALGGPGNVNLSLVASLLAVDLAGSGRGDVVIGVGLLPIVPPAKLPLRVLRPGAGGAMSDVTRQLFGGGSLPSAAGPRVLYKTDVNRDGRPDLFCACQGYDGSPADGETNLLLTQNANGTFTDRSSLLPSQPDYTHSAAIGDVNGDGFPDIYVGNLSNTTATGSYFLMGRADGGYDKVTSSLPTDITSQTLPNSKLYTTSLLVDVDKDGFPDLVLGAEGSTTQASIVLFNDGTGNFTVRPRYTLPTGPLGSNYVALDLQTIDANGDGYPDLLMVSTQFNPNYVGGSIRLLINQKNGTFVDETVARLGAQATVTTGRAWNTTQVVDINGDGKPDFVSSGEFWDPATHTLAFLWVNDGTGHFTPIVLGTLPAGPIGKIVATDVDGDGRPDLVAVTFDGDGYIRYQTFLNRDAQTIAFGPLPDRPLTSATFTVSATASSGLPVTFTGTPGVCKVTGAVVTLLNSGWCSITANQAGDATYGAAPSVVRSFTVGLPTGGWLIQSGGFDPFVLYGPVAVGDHQDWGASITNVGTASVNVGAATFTGPYSLQFNGCAPVLASGASCYVSFLLSPLVAGSANGALSLANSGGNNPFVLDLAATATDAYTAPTMQVTFSNASPAPGSITRLTYTLGNPNPGVLSNVGAFVALQPGFQIAPTPDPTTTCGGAWQSGIAGGSFAGFGNGTLAGNASCSISLQIVVPTVTGTYTQYTGSFWSDQVRSANPNAASITVASPLLRDANGDGYSDIFLQHATYQTTYVWLINGTPNPSINLLTNEPNYRVVGLGDVDGSGTLDMVMRDGAGNNRLALLGSASPGTMSATGVSALPAAGLNWAVAGLGDFDGDGKADILWREVAGYNHLYFGYNAGTVQQSAVAGVSIDWKVGAIADFDGDGKADILWRNINGANYLWFMDGPSVKVQAAVAGLGADWSIAGVADFDRDGKPDILWRNINGANGLWLMNGSTVKQVVNVPGVSTDWRIVGVGDYNRDGYADILWEQTAVGTRVIWFLRSGAYQGEVVLPGTGDIRWQVVNPKSDR